LSGFKASDFSIRLHAPIQGLQLIAPQFRLRFINARSTPGSLSLIFQSWLHAALSYGFSGWSRQ
jgi:hypothetical protein